MTDHEKGWFQLPGLRPNGDRTIEEQCIGLEQALQECAGRSVLDLGCAEGAISLRFAEAGASDVLGIEILQRHLKYARKICKNYKQVRFVQAHIGDYINGADYHAQFDIVLALGIIHKLDDPAVPLRFAARSCRDLLLYRASAHAKDGIIKSKHTKMPCDVPAVLAQEGFTEERLVKGVRGEAVQYWRRVR